jgi:hypothetical protein
MKDEALKLALEALRFARDDGYENEVSQQAITAIKQARAAPVQEPVVMTFDEAYASLSWNEWRMRLIKELLAELHRLTIPPAAQPAPKQEPFGYFKAEPFGWTDCAETDEGAMALYEYPAAQPAVPDAIGPNEDELPAYAAGWNDCRQAMLEMMK